MGGSGKAHLTEGRWPLGAAAWWVAVALLVAAGTALSAAGGGQRGRGAGGGPAPSARQGPPVELTGYWVSVVSEDWRFRMLTPRKGDFRGVPLNAEGRKVAEAWDPAQDAARGNECRAYGAGGILRVPGRLHITWQDETTLKIETDAGQQVRLLYFGAPPSPAGPPTWQGQSVAAWQRQLVDPEVGLLRPSDQLTWGTLRVVTTRLRLGYLRKNGVPYSEETVLTEYFDRHTAPNGDEWLTVTTIVNDPKYLTREFIPTTDFKKEPDGSKWNPTPCETT